MASEGVSAQGTLVEFSHDPNWPPGDPVGGPLSWMLIGERRNITPPGKKRNVLDLTNHDSQDEESTVGVRRPGEMKINIAYVPKSTSHNNVVGLEKQIDEGNRVIFRITYPDNPGGTGTQWLTSGYVTEIQPTAPVDEVLTADVTIKPTGARLTIPAA